VEQSSRDAWRKYQRAYQRDPVAVERWRRETFPAIARQAKAEGGEVFFWDAAGCRADTVHGKTWGRTGQTLVVERPGQRQSISAASALNASGAFWHCTYEGGLNAELFIALLRKMMRRRLKPLPARLRPAAPFRRARLDKVTLYVR
jgi:hypothetical protein